ncbi:hypothetical protein PVK06_003007 [Gossypium arboreum]|uniref:Uncharacterized protein n=1 Tax=Gossypium arboreum TaxID=29729 RepID=A0ABR0R5D2_GOSAR|nr:hypothetical protein PVK06_003007 [Gossypium arboreum]
MSPRRRCSKIAEQTEDSESYFLDVAVEQIKATNYGRSYLPEVVVEQIEATSLISLMLQRSRLKTANLISLTLQ